MRRIPCEPFAVPKTDNLVQRSTTMTMQTRQWTMWHRGWSMLRCGGVGLLLLAGMAGAQPFPGGLPACLAALNTWNANLGTCPTDLGACEADLGTCSTRLLMGI